MSVTNETYVAAVNRIDKLEAVLRQIVNEYDQTHGGEIHSDGSWSSAASIPVDVMESAKALLK